MMDFYVRLCVKSKNDLSFFHHVRIFCKSQFVKMRNIDDRSCSCKFLVHNFRCIQTIRVHTDSVWALLATENFQYVISGGRDKKVYFLLKF